MATQIQTRPVKNVMYGVTHSLDGRPIVREPRTLKVGIGLPKGKALHVWIDRDGKWCVLVGDKRHDFQSKDEARAFYATAKKGAPERKYPQKRPYFIFTRISSDGLFEPDWDAIEANGPLPTRIDIIFMDDEPFSCSYQMWSAAELKCDGDGMNAMRVLSMAKTPQEKELAEEAKRNGEKMFPIVNGCRMLGCPYASGDRPACKPHGRLLFQLPKAPRLGGSAFYDTTGYRSTSQIFSNLLKYRSVSGEGDPERGFVAGVPFKLVVQPYTTTHAGQMATQFGVHIELEEENVFALKQKLIESGHKFRNIGRGLISAPAIPAVEIEPQIPQPVQAQMIEAEFNEDPRLSGPAEESDDLGYTVDPNTGEIIVPSEVYEYEEGIDGGVPIETQAVMMPRRICKDAGAGNCQS